jgi:hypothetical protein
VRRDYNEYYQVWDLYYIHWAYHNEYFAKKHMLKYLSNIRFWHLHKLQEYSMATPLTKNALSSKSIPCLCGLNPEYMRNKPSDWDNWFNICYVNPDWTFNDYNIVITNNTFIFNWKKYTCEI